MRKTKIICTIGPSSENEETLTQMCLAGMNVARLNFSHGTHEEHAKKIALIKQVRQKLGLPIAIMLDTKGPEYRIRTFAAGKVTIAEGSSFTFTTDEVEGFLGSAGVLLLFLALIFRLIKMAERQPFRFGRVYGYCVLSVFLFHVFINVGMVLGLTPVIGIPLPFFSYGGSSLWGFSFLLFIFLRIDAGRNLLRN